MSAHDEARQVAAAIRRHARRRDRRKGAGRYRGVVVTADPLTVDVPALDDTLEDDEVAIGGALAKHLDDDGPLREGDNLVLLEIADDDYVAVEVLRADGEED